MVNRHILIVSNDLLLCESIQDKLKNDAADIHCVASVSAAINCLTNTEYCLILLDLQLPSTDKLEMIRILRIIGHIPLMIISNHLEPNELIELYQSGANACLEKPIDTRVCAAQAIALIDLYLQSDMDAQKWDARMFGSALIISPRYRQVLMEGKQIELRRKEFDLLHHFALHPYQVFSAGQLYEQVWENPSDISGENTVISHINTLRKKLGKMGPKVIETLRGFGYRFVPPPDSTV